MNRQFADVSNNNSQLINWNVYKKVGQHVLVGLKATEGLTFIDKTHASRAYNAHHAGVWVVHYHFAHPDESPEAQAKLFWNTAKYHFAKKDFLCLDIERGSANRATAQWCDAFQHTIKRYAGHSLIGYASESYLAALSDVQIKRWWVAAYGGQGKAPRGYFRWAHQFTDGVIGPQPHTCAGIGHCDISTLNWGTYLGLRASRP